MPEGQEIPEQKSHQDTFAPQAKDKDASPGHDKEPGSTLAERHPDWPQVKVKFYFSAHLTDEDIAGMKQYLEDADIYFNENASEHKITELLQKLADMDPKEFPLKDFDRDMKNSVLNGTDTAGIIRSIHGSKKIMGDIDLRPGDPISFADMKSSMSKDYLDDDFDTTLHNLKENARGTVALQDQREEIMTARFEEELEKIINTHPELKDKPELSILITMGASHTPLFHKFKANGVEVDRAFPEKPYLYSFGEEVQRDLVFGKEPSREILAKAYFEKIINKMINSTLLLNKKGHFKNTENVLVYMRHVASQFSTSEIEEIHKRKFTLDTFNALLQSKGISPLPKSDKELHKYVTPIRDEIRDRYGLPKEKKEHFWQRRVFQKGKS